MCLGVNLLTKLMSVVVSVKGSESRTCGWVVVGVAFMVLGEKVCMTIAMSTASWKQGTRGRSRYGAPPPGLPQTLN